MKKRLKVAIFFGVASMLVIGFALNPFASATVPGNNTRVSLTGGGAQSSSHSVRGSISRDGRFVVFTNNQNNFVGSDSNNAADVFIRNLSTGTVVRASVSTSGVSANVGSTLPVISETGRYVVFASMASNLIDSRTITTSYLQLYMRDTVASTTSLLTEVSTNTYADQNAIPLDVSNDGRFILFMSQATNLGPTVPSGYDNLFLLDRNTGTISWVNAQGPGIAFGLSVRNAQMSCDGSFIVFDSSAAYLGLPSSAHTDIFLLDRRGGDTLTNITGVGNGAAFKPEISCNGNYIGFASSATNLDPLFSPSGHHAYIYSRLDSEFRLLDQSSGGSVGNATVMNISSDPFYLSLSDDGAAVFGSQATNLDAAATSGNRQFFVRDPQAGTTELLTRDNGGTEGNNTSQVITVTHDGTLAAYESYASNLISGDTNGVRDIFVSETGL